MRILSHNEIMKCEDRTDIILNAEFTQEEIDSMSLVSPSIFVTVKNGVIDDITLCDEGFPVDCIFSDEEINEITQFIQALSEVTTQMAEDES